MSSREHYTVSGNSKQELITSLNFALSRISDRIDKMEGVRGTPTFESNIDLQSNKITDASQGTDSNDGVVVTQLPSQGLNTGDAPTFASVTGQAICVTDTNGTEIHSFGVK